MLGNEDECVTGIGFDCKGANASCDCVSDSLHKPQLAHQLRATNLNNNNHNAQCPHGLHSVHPFGALDSLTTRRPFSIEGVKQIKTLSNVLLVGMTPRLGKQSPGV